jgi:hypothetical protein
LDFRKRNGKLEGIDIITKGVCFSYYEFLNDELLTDQVWQNQIGAGKIPAKPTWLKELFANSPSLKTKPWYNF